MPQAVEPLRALLLDMLSPHEAVRQAALTRLNEDDWPGVLGMARQHRLEPLLHWRLSHEAILSPVPESVRETLSGRFRQATLRALALRRDLLQACQALDAVGIEAVALKGAYLAFHVYPHPALRPLRDLDVLVPRESALAAWHALLQAGWQRVPEYDGDPAACVAASKHLPPLRSASARITLELHVRLHEPDPAAPDQSMDETGMRARLMGGGEASLRYLSTTDLLLHLIVHAAYDHHFNNGPLLLADVFYLVQQGDIDWPLFWRLAEAGGWQRGCVLVLRMLACHAGDPGVPLPMQVEASPGEVDRLAAESLQLMLAELGGRGDLGFLGRLSSRSLREKWAFLWSRAFPSRRAVSAFFHAGDTPWGVCKGYLKRYALIARRRLPSLWANRTRAVFRADTGKYARLERWLRES